MEQNLGKFKGKGAVEYGGEAGGKDVEDGGCVQAPLKPSRTLTQENQERVQRSPSGGSQGPGGPAEGLNPT